MKREPMMFAREHSLLLLALVIAMLLIALTFAQADHAALFPSLGPTKVVGETWINH